MKALIKRSFCFALLILVLSPAITQNPSSQAKVHQGDMAPSFTVTSTDGYEISDYEFRGKVLLLNFFATW